MTYSLDDEVGLSTDMVLSSLDENPALDEKERVIASLMRERDMFQLIVCRPDSHVAMDMVRLPFEHKPRRSKREWRESLNAGVRGKR